MLVMIDNYDSFVYNLVRYFEELGQEIKVFRNDHITVKEIEELKPEGIVLSPGPKNPKEAGITLEILDYFKGKVPILGICLGHQSIIQYFGGTIIEGERPVHGKISPVHHRGEGLFRCLPSPINVTRYHSLVGDAKGLPTCLHVTAKSDDNVIMGIEHINYPIHGLQFHPEAELTEYGHELLGNFIDCLSKCCKEAGEEIKDES